MAVVDAHGLGIGYAGRTVIPGIELSLGPGEALALVGANGSGKSTLLKTLAGLIPPTGGELTILGAPAGRLGHRIAYLGQFHTSGGMLPMQVRDVVLMARYRHRGLLRRLDSADRDAVERAMAALDITSLARRPLRALSGGQQRRVHLAYTLAREADLLLLDEPTAGLDAAANDRYVQMVQSELARGASVVTATHDVGDAARAQQVMLLAGRVVATGSPREVLTPERLAEALGIALLAVPHGDHTDLLHPEHPHAHPAHAPTPTHGPITM